MTHHQAWLGVKRTINGATRRYIEFFEENFEEGDAIADAYFVDSGVTYSGAQTTISTGLDHLEGQTVTVLVDGSVQADKVVTGGSITLDPPATTTTHVGLSYNSDLETLNLEANTGQNTLQGKKQKIATITSRFQNTVGGKLGRDANNLDPLKGRRVSDNMNEPVQPFSGDQTTVFNGDYGSEATMYYRQDQPLPMTITGVMPELSTGGRA